MNKTYIVRLEEEVTTVDLMEVEVEAVSKDEAKCIAVDSYKKGQHIEIDRWCSDTKNTHLMMSTFLDWEVNEKDEK